ncbi:biotin carboxylase N-terminal domain-containing protein [Flexivirga caeni]|uniref:ATP-grasp domain-containing protein n=1 Tax=Flexivirga caeni TaxID=2294115 RepID=A0A3M9MBM1_9MICO|nr:biotin carboxylase N-terminal domain-containing protein [Flexivirga caeni]RNI22914.1 ATP-grasp domain-containing protein [Flexivirga caeni]
MTLSSTLSIRSVLVANRGEIALRVFRTARRLGLRTIALYTDLDVTAPHVRAADDAVWVPSYLDIDAVVAAALSSGADVVHPGYGFLSERSGFAAALRDAGVVLAGPSPEVMELMGRKDVAREVAVAAGVPVVPSYSFDDDPHTFAYPILVKAAAGGGGKGMRVVQSADDFAEAIAAARRESAHAFGDDVLLLEKYVESGRHLEVQVMADTHGTALHLWERDCSSQRRHQKVLEEAPAPTIDDDLRERLCSAAVDLTRQAGYAGAGTVEFLLDSATNEFYFLEMNTRLQVEHPVTEAITGLDLVELQLLVADGQPLPLAQEQVSSTGHAIEARVYAEDAFGGFLPQAGTATAVRWPDTLARVDQALESGQEVSTSYDPMLGKVIVHAADREAARQGLIAALDATAICGLTTNTGFLRALLATDEFRNATIDTAWLDHHEVAAPDAASARAAVAWRLATRDPDGGTPFVADGFRIAGEPAPVRVHLDRPVLVEPMLHRVDGEAVRVLGDESVGADGIARLDLDLENAGRQTVFVRPARRGAEAIWHGQRFVLVSPDRASGGIAAASDGTVVAPMPGTVLDVRVSEGARVSAGDVLGAMEAMKMELTLKAPHDGTVTRVGAHSGDQVALGASLFVVTPAESASTGSD